MCIEKKKYIHIVKVALVLQEWDEDWDNHKLSTCLSQRLFLVALLDTKIKSIMFRAKVRNFLLEVVLDHLHPILDLQVDLRLLKMVPNDSPWPKTLGLTPKTILPVC